VEAHLKVESHASDLHRGHRARQQWLDAPGVRLSAAASFAALSARGKEFRTVSAV
jgi:hypothetical protein